MDQEEDTPFWVHKNNNHHCLRRTYSLLLTITTFLVLLLITTLVFTLIVVPTLSSFTFNIFKPQAFKHSWESLNLILVLSAVICAFLTKNDNTGTQTPNSSNSETPPFWYQQSNQSFNRLRSFTSYPNLRQPSLSVTDDEGYRFYDDTHIRYSRLGDEDELHRETVAFGAVSSSPIREPEVKLKPFLESQVEAVRRNVERTYIAKPEIKDTRPMPLQLLPAVRKKKSRSASAKNAAMVSSEEFSASSLQQSEINSQLMQSQSLSAVRKKKSRSASTENAVSVTSEDFSASSLRQPEINLQPPQSQPIPVVRKKKSRSASTENTVTVSSEDFSASSLRQSEINLQPPPSQQILAVRKKKSRNVFKEKAATFTSVEVSALSLPQLVVNLQPPPFTALPPVIRTKAVRQNVQQTYQSETMEKMEHNDFVVDNSQLPPPEVAPPLTAERKNGIQVKKKRVNTTKEFLTSSRGKKKKQRQKSVGNFESLLNSQHSPIVSQPPPLPPPPPPSVFHSLFSSNKSKHKKHYLVPMARESSHYRLKDNVIASGSDNESPLIPIPPPPPPPPFKLPSWKFRVQGDYVWVDSIGSSRSGSPDSDEVVESPISQCSNSPYAEDKNGNGSGWVRVSLNPNTHPKYAPESKMGNSSAASLFCPSPDVDTKAHNFIQNFRAGLRMAKMNSMKEKQGIGRSNLGPLPNP